MKGFLIIFMLVWGFCNCCQVYSQPWWPIGGYTYPDVITSPYGYRENNGPKWHSGFDMRAHYVPIYASDEGAVIRRDSITAPYPEGGPGLFIVIKHDYYDDIAKYLHLSEAIDLGAGVDLGEWIGTSGNTGRDIIPYDPHLHFGYSIDDEDVIHPLCFLPYINEDVPHLIERELIWQGSYIDKLKFLIKEPYSEDYCDIDFNSMKAGIYLFGSYRWEEQDLIYWNYDGGRYHYKNWGEPFGEVTITPHVFDPDIYPDHELEIEWDPTPTDLRDTTVSNGHIYVYLNEIFNICLSGWDDCSWGNYWKNTPEILIDDFEGNHLGKGRISISWYAYLRGIQGFDLYRTSIEDTTVYHKLNDSPIKAASVKEYEDSYEYLDTGIKKPGLYKYKLVCVHEDGSTEPLPQYTLRVEVVLPLEFGLSSIYPNPFNNNATISYSLNGAKRDRVLIQLFDIQGRKVKTLRDEIADPGTYQMTFAAINEKGRELATGIYFVKMRYGDRAVSKQITLMK